MSTHQGSISSPISETSADAVHHAPEQHLQELAPKPAQYEQQQQQYGASHSPRGDPQPQHHSRSASVYGEISSTTHSSADYHDGQAAAATVTVHQRPTASSNAASAGSGVSATVCSNCGTTTTPLWRRAPNGETICNACGLYLKARNTVRPLWLKRNAIKKPAAQPAHEARDGSCAADGHCNGTGGSARCDGCPAYNQHQVNRQALVCANCRTTTTPLWRRDETGNTICNACGLYYKLHNVHRPVTMKRSVIKRRKRVALASSPQPAHHHHHHQHIAPSPASSAGNEDSEDSLERLPPLDNASPSESSSGAEDEVSDVVSRKRKTSSSLDAPADPQAKRLAIQVPPIEDYIVPRRAAHHDSWYQHSSTTPTSSSSEEDRRRSLSPVEPAPFQHTAQVQIHGHHYSHVPTAPAAYQHRGHSPPTSPPPTSSSDLSRLLNPTTPASPPSAILPSISLPNMAAITAAPAQGYPFPAMTMTEQAQHVLQAHRQELQREVSNLSMLLTRTAAMLSNLDQAMAATGSAPATQQQQQQQPPTPVSTPGPGVPPLASLLGTDPATSTALASFMALASAAQQVANAQAAAASPTATSTAATTSMLPPPQYQLPPVGRSYWTFSPPRSGADSPPQRIPTPPARGL